MAKGGQFERDVCKWLSLWWTDDTRHDIFSRTRGSGSALKRGGSKWEGGDIGFVDPIGEPLIRHCNIEAKTGYATKSKLKSGKTRESNWCVLDSLDSILKQPTLEKMWEQCERDALITGREPWLIFRRFRRSACIAFTLSFFLSLIEMFGHPPRHIPLARLRFTPSGTDTLPTTLQVLLLTQFFEWVPDIRPFYNIPKRMFVP